MSNAESIHEIQQRMQEVRQEMRHEVDHLVASARVMTDWRHYFRAYPWTFATTAAMLGYFLVPKKRRIRLSELEMETMAHKIARVEPSVGQPVRENRFVREATKAIAMTALRGVLGYAGQRLATHSLSNQMSNQESESY